MTRAATEQDRLAALRRYGVLDTGPEQAFDDLVELARDLCGSSIALVNLIDEDRGWFKSRSGLDICAVDRDVAFCAYTLAGPDIVEVPDARLDPRFRANPLVVGGPFVRFYAGAPLLTPEGAVLGALCVFDIVPRVLTSRQRRHLAVLARQVMAQLELRRQAMIDPLTELPNRTLLLERLEMALSRESLRSAESGIALLFVDLDGFKAVNDADGHARGDALLRDVADALSGCVRVTDTVARLGGDEFVVLCEDLVDGDEAASVAARIEKAVARVSPPDVPVTASVGVAYATAGMTGTDLMHCADAAMYRAKQAGKAQVVVFE